MTLVTNTNGPSAELKAAIDEAFGSLDEMKAKFNAVRATPPCPLPPTPGHPWQAPPP